MANFEALIKLVNVETGRTDLDNLVNASVEDVAPIA